MKIISSLVVVCLISIQFSSQNIHLIQDYLNYSQIKTALFVTCESTNELMKIVAELHNSDTYAIVWSIKNESVAGTLNYTQFFVRLGAPHMVVVDLNCGHVNSFLEQSSQRKLFHLERSWLMFSKSLKRSRDILGQQNINLDADVCLVVYQKENRLVINEDFEHLCFVCRILNS